MSRADDLNNSDTLIFRFLSNNLIILIYEKTFPPHLYNYIH